MTWYLCYWCPSGWAGLCFLGLSLTWIIYYRSAIQEWNTIYPKVSTFALLKPAQNDKVYGYNILIEVPGDTCEHEFPKENPRKKGRLPIISKMIYQMEDIL